MDERFSAVSKVPEDALKQISAGRLKGKSDINPAWKVAAMTEVYGLCGEGWYYDIVEEKTFNTNDGEILLFLKVNLYYRTKEGGWSSPVVGFGGDFIVKKERDGLRANDEAYKMCLTDALGNALKQVGVAHSVFRGFWDGTKYTRDEDSAIVKEPELYREENGKVYVYSARNKKYYQLEALNIEALNNLANDSRFSAIGAQIRRVMMDKSAA